MRLVDDPPTAAEQQPFSPDDYVSPVTDVANIASPENRAVISPPGAFASIQERMDAENPYAMPEQSQFLRPPGAVSEIEHFSGAYMAAIGGLSPMTPPQPQMGYVQAKDAIPGPPKGGAWLTALTGVDGVSPPQTAQQEISRSVDPVVPAATTNRYRDDSIDAFAALQKESEGYAKRKFSTEPFPCMKLGDRAPT